MTNATQWTAPSGLSWTAPDATQWTAPAVQWS